MRRGQVWIETVLYTLIGLALMGVVLAFITPKLNSEKDRITVEQTINTLNDFDSKVNDVLRAPGNVREVSMNMQRGTFYINSTDDSIRFYISDLSSPYSEPNVSILIGRVSVISQKTQKGGSVVLSLQYTDNITYNRNDIDKSFAAAATPYKFAISNLGIVNDATGQNVISIDELSS